MYDALHDRKPDPEQRVASLGVGLSDARSRRETPKQRMRVAEKLAGFRRELLRKLLDLRVRRVLLRKRILRRSKRAALRGPRWPGKLRSRRSQASIHKR